MQVLPSRAPTSIMLQHLVDGAFGDTLSGNIATLPNPRSRYPQPFVKWAGGKSQLLPQISAILPRRFGMYFEPFVGGGAVYFHLRPKTAVISDANFELINAYRVIKNDLEALIHQLEILQQKPISPGLYDRYRRMNPEKLPSVKRAVRFIFLNKTCYNGLYRVNRKGKFNVPFGKYPRMPKLAEEANLTEVRKILRSAEIMCASYQIGLDRASEGDVVYLDPPYSPDLKSPSFTSYTKESFSFVDQRRLAARFKELDRRGCLLVLSNSDTRLVRDLYSGYTRIRLKSGRMINCVGNERMGYRELLILNYKIPMEDLIPWVKISS
jgi:DNA adenine methylase